jgi:ABC-type uncharacterized transport system permease subunit
MDNGLAALLGASPTVFVGLTTVLVGGAAILAGRAVAGNWKPAWHVVAACFGLTVADRFLIYALFEGNLLSAWGFLLHFAVLLALGLASWQIARVSKMVGQYPWRYQRTSPFAYAEMKDG